jgi:hypothetical protein
LTGTAGLSLVVEYLKDADLAALSSLLETFQRRGPDPCFRTLDLCFSSDHRYPKRLRVYSKRKRVAVLTQRLLVLIKSPATQPKFDENELLKTLAKRMALLHTFK